MSTLDTFASEALKSLVCEVLENGAWADRDDRIVVRDTQRPVPRSVIDFLIARELVAEGPEDTFVATTDGRTVLTTLRTRGTEALALRKADDGPLISNMAESPVTRLAIAKGGRTAFLSVVEASAADRLRRDFELAQMMPHLGVDWSADRRGGPSTGDRHEDVMLAARERLDKTLKRIGPDFATLLVDVCCLLIGLADVERKHGLPQRSGKVVLRLGLRALARHYGTLR